MPKDNKAESGEERTKKRTYRTQLKEISSSKLKQVIENLKKGKAPGPDDMGNEAWIHDGSVVREKLIDLLNGILRGDPIPKNWRYGNQVPIFKKGVRSKAENYRGITLIDASYKILTEIIKRRMDEKMEKKHKYDMT